MKPLDFGPIYRETNMAQFPVEPWNTGSNLIFIAIFIYWLWKIKGQYQKYRVITFSLPILLAGWLGGTVYHATRSHDFWLYLDFIPIYLLSFVVAFRYWIKISNNKFKIIFGIFLPYFILNYSVAYLPVTQNTKASLGYFMLAFTVAVPLLWYAYRNQRPYNSKLIYATLSFIIAISARTMDKYFPETFTTLFPMGTHWIWHTMGGVTSFILFQYVYEDITYENENSQR